MILILFNFPILFSSAKIVKDETRDFSLDRKFANKMNDVSYKFKQIHFIKKHKKKQFSIF